MHLLINSTFPKDAKKRRLWEKALNRDGFVPLITLVCVQSTLFTVGIVTIQWMRIISSSYSHTRINQLVLKVRTEQPEEMFKGCM